MKNWFFHQEKGTTLGPITLEEIRSRVREGRIRMYDLVYREGEPGWRMALEHPDLRGEFASSTVKTLTSRPWVCLQRKSADRFEFGTSGPFSTEDIQLQLAEGLISYSDYVWRDGFSEWRRIGTLEDFNRRLSEANERGVRRRAEEEKTPSLPAVPGKELLKSVVEMKRPVAPSVLPPPVPKEATTPDLTQLEVETPTVEKRKHNRPVSNERRRPSFPPASKPERRRRSAVWVDWAVVVILAGVLGAIALALTRYLPSRAPELPSPSATADLSAPVSPTASERPIPAEEKPAPVLAVEPEPKPVSIKSAPATELALSASSSGANQIKIELRTDAAGDENPIYLQIVGLPGQVSEGGAYYKFLRLEGQGDRREPLEIPSLNLPQGKFIVRAESVV